MSYLVLARKYRPKTFDEVIGQDGVVRTLKNAINMGRVAHAYVFTGARGVGKTTVARLLAKALNCECGPNPTPNPCNTCSNCKEITLGISPDVFEIDGASNTGVDDVRGLRESSQYMPAHSRYKIYIIDEVHMLSTSAFNALLKILEEPPRHVKFIFATTEPHKIPLTVLSRCQRFDFKRVSAPQMQTYLQHILALEKAQFDEQALRLITRQADGSVRDCMSLADQILAFAGKNITGLQVREALGLVDNAVYEQVIAAILNKRPKELMHIIENLFCKGCDLNHFLEGLMWYVHHLVLICTIGDIEDLVDLLPEERCRMHEQAKLVDVLKWYQVFDVLMKTFEELSHNPYPRIVLESALLRLSAIESMVSVDDILSRVENLSRSIGKTDSKVANISQNIGRAKSHSNALPLGPSSARSTTEQKPSLPLALNKTDNNKRKIWEKQIEDNVQDTSKLIAAAVSKKRVESKKELQRRVLSHPIIKEAIRVFNAEIEDIHTEIKRE